MALLLRVIRRINLGLFCSPVDALLVIRGVKGEEGQGILGGGGEGASRV